MRFYEFPPFIAFQDGLTSLADYLAELADFLGILPADALAVHNGVLRDMMPGTLDVILELDANDIATGCLSNTNGPHWERLVSPDFPNVHRLGVKMASHVVQLSKPDPAIFHAFESVTQRDGRDIYFFDDTLVNVQAASARGWNVCHVAAGEPVSVKIRTALEQWNLLESTLVR